MCLVRVLFNAATYQKDPGRCWADFDKVFMGRFMVNYFTELSQESHTRLTILAGQRFPVAASIGGEIAAFLTLFEPYRRRFVFKMTRCLGRLEPEERNWLCCCIAAAIWVLALHFVLVNFMVCQPGIFLAAGFLAAGFLAAGFFSLRSSSVAMVTLRFLLFDNTSMTILLICSFSPLMKSAGS